MLYYSKKSKLKNNKILLDLLEEKLPLDVLHHIYTYCDINEKNEIRKHIQKKYDIVFIGLFIINSIIMYFVGYAITKKFLGVFLILNFLLGYLIITGSFLSCLIICLPIKLCIKK